MASTVGAVNPIRYRSYYYDTDTGFYYLQTRYYDPAIRRFINADGYINANGDILGFNMYAYCGNNPVNCADYNGKDAIYVVNKNYSNLLIQVTGHAILYIQDSNGNWYITQFTGTQKSNATVTIEPVVMENDYTLNDILNSKEIQGISYVRIRGNFDRSIAHASDIQENNPNYGGYNLLNNNCLDYVQEIIQRGDIKGTHMPNFVQNDTAIPIEYADRIC